MVEIKSNSVVYYTFMINLGFAIKYKIHSKFTNNIQFAEALLCKFTHFLSLRLN